MEEVKSRLRLLCHGRGLLVCKTGNGSKKIKGGTACPTCNGTGKGETCPVCSGNGQVFTKQGGTR